MAAEIRPLIPAVAFRFDVTFGGLSAGFSKVSGLREESDVIEYREGTDDTKHRKFPGLRTFPNIVCERGLGASSILVKLRKTVLECKMKRDSMVIKVMSCTGNTMRTITAEAAWIVALEIGDLDANSSEVAIEIAEFAHEGVYKNVMFSEND